MLIELNIEIQTNIEDGIKPYGDILGASININENQQEIDDVIRRLNLALESVGFEPGIFVKSDAE